ncbi:MAG: hypothetical protein HC903_28105 [Methylacidiphilales bacterium]|nr:hypothetical protein [Candidatus Methylacidiphilales bacterium]
MFNSNFAVLAALTNFLDLSSLVSTLQPGNEARASASGQSSMHSLVKLDDSHDENFLLGTWQI